MVKTAVQVGRYSTMRTLAIIDRGGRCASGHRLDQRGHRGQLHIIGIVPLPTNLGNQELLPGNQLAISSRPLSKTTKP